MTDRGDRPSPSSVAAGLTRPRAVGLASGAMERESERTGGRAPLSSGGGALLFPRTLDGAHQRLDFHEGRFEELLEQIGEEPSPVQGREGKGLLLFLHNVSEGQKVRAVVDKAELDLRERWRVRWTILAAGVGFLVGLASIANAVRGWMGH